MELTAQGKEVPPSKTSTKAAHIIPFSLNKFNEDKDLVSRIFFVYLTLILLERKILHLGYASSLDRPRPPAGWQQLVGSNINSPDDGIFMNDLDHLRFGSFFF